MLLCAIKPRAIITLRFLCLFIVFCKKLLQLLISSETGLFFGKKNNFLENQNILISGIVKNETQEMKWEIEKLV